MATGAERLQQIAGELRSGQGSSSSVTVRNLLSWFGAQRRGYWIAAAIREALETAELKTEPDFESAYIDAPISFVLAESGPAEQPSLIPSTEPTVVEGSMAPKLDSVPAQASSIDATYRISKLAAANNQPVSVKPDAMLKIAITLMLTKDFSQLPVMTSEREVKGVISWMTIGARKSLGISGTCVREFMDPTYQEIRANASIFQAVPIIIEHQYVLVRGTDSRITGIVTASDLSNQFPQQAEPFLLLGEIENHIRKIVDNRFTRDELASASDPADAARKVKGVADLTYGEYIRLLDNPDRWEKLGLPIDRTTFCKELDLVRLIRNDVMHFDPDGPPEKDLKLLRDFTKFLNRLQGIGIP